MDPKAIAEAARALTDADTTDLPPVDEAGGDGPAPAPKGKRARIDTISEDEREAGEKPTGRRGARAASDKDPDDEETDTPPAGEEGEDPDEGEEGTEEGEEGEDEGEGDEDAKAKPTPARVAKAWNQVRRQMREVRQAREALAQEKAQVQETLRQAQAVNANWEKLKASPIRALKTAGWEWEKLLEHVATHGDEGEPEPDPEVVALRQRVDEAERKERERDAQAKIEVFQRAIHSMVHAEESPYPVLKATKGEGLIYETAREIFRKTGKVPKTEDVAARLEAEALNQLRDTLTSPQLRKVLGLSGQVTPTGSKDQRATTHPGTKPRTISTRRMGNARSQPRNDDDYGSDDDVEARAIAAFERAKRSG